MELLSLNDKKHRTNDTIKNIPVTTNILINVSLLIFILIR